MRILTLLFFLVSFISQAQNFKLKNRKLIQYYDLTNEAEKKIINNDLIGANNLYKKAFKEFKYPHAKDLHNGMKVALKIKDMEVAYNYYQSLKCLGKEFSDDFLKKTFENPKQYKQKTCKNVIDLKYKKSLDSLFEIDQYYRKLSNGNYAAYKKELTISDSITSTNLLKLIQKQGFPNEYNIGLGSANDMYYQKFYYIIWHQLASNLYSSQKVNFSNEMEKALNKGKIRPDIAGHLFDLNNNTYNYSYFKIYQFTASDGKNDCCYVSSSFLPEKRTEKAAKIIEGINNRRREIGLSSTEDEISKNIFLLENKDYVFLSVTIEGWNFTDKKDIDLFKKDLKLIKLNDTTH